MNKNKIPVTIDISLFFKKNTFANNMSGDNSYLESQENGIQYLSAVEGINQMSDDAKYIKENY